MVAGCVSDEAKFAVGLDRLWKVLRDDHVHLPKMVPDHVASAEIVEGDGGPGTVKKIAFTPAAKIVIYVKRRLVMLDESNHVFKYEVLEGGVSEKIKSQTFEFKFESTGDVETCVVRLKVEYDTVDDEPLGAEEEKKLIQGPFMLFRGVEEYLLANPGA
ncbi:major pollen allergen Bet v 1-G-like [Ananas comosus]|uniref:Major pollen allergen Bet v 1-G-like n=1 Tax=Ananas comosus TaxID=4615 RepID=A0A6P5FYM2_ANACO|nr:major pollen allergen Bet v 1-G-like [Ananas comosus]